MPWGRVTYEMMESYWPAVASGEQAAPPSMREWAIKLEAKPKYVVSSTRKDKFLVHPRITGHGPTLHGDGLPRTRRLELVAAAPLRNGAVAMDYRRAD